VFGVAALRAEAAFFQAVFVIDRRADAKEVGIVGVDKKASLRVARGESCPDAISCCSSIDDVCDPAQIRVWPFIERDVIRTTADLVCHSCIVPWPALPASFDEEVLILLHVTSLCLFAASAHLSDVAPSASFFDETSPCRVLARDLIESRAASSEDVLARLVSLAWIGRVDQFEGSVVLIPRQLALNVARVAFELGRVVHFRRSRVPPCIDALVPPVARVVVGVRSAWNGAGSESSCVEVRVEAGINSTVNACQLASTASKFPRRVEVASQPRVAGSRESHAMVSAPRVRDGT